MGIVGFVAGCEFVSGLAAPQSTDSQSAARSVDLEGPSALAIDGDILYILETDFQNSRPRIRRLDLRTATIATLNTSIPLEIPSDLAVTGGSLIIPDSTRLIRVNVQTGIVTTIAGNGNYSRGDNVDGSALTVPLEPDSVAVGLNGNVYFGEFGRVGRLDTRTGFVSTVAGHGGLPRNPTTSGDGGSALAARLGYPSSVAVDAAGNLYIAQTGEYADGDRIRRIDAGTGRIDTVVGPGTRVDGGMSPDGAPWRIRSPHSLTWDGSGRLLFLCELNGRHVLRYNPVSRTVVSVAGSPAGDTGEGVPASRATLQEPHGLAVDRFGNIFFAEYLANRVRRIDAASGLVQTVAGTGRPSPPPIMMDADIGYAPPGAETCQNEPREPELRVSVTDTTGGALPGAPVSLIDLQSSTPAQVWRTDQQGEVTIHAKESGEYVVTAAVAGFVPEVRGVSLSSGCSGRVTFALKLSIRK
jgi:streptogramin lyase